MISQVRPLFLGGLLAALTACGTAQETRSAAYFVQHQNELREVILACGLGKASGDVCEQARKAQDEVRHAYDAKNREAGEAMNKRLFGTTGDE